MVIPSSIFYLKDNRTMWSLNNKSSNVVHPLSIPYLIKNTSKYVDTAHKRTDIITDRIDGLNVLIQYISGADKIIGLVKILKYRSGL